MRINLNILQVCLTLIGELFAKRPLWIRKDTSVYLDKSYRFFKSAWRCTIMITWFKRTPVYNGQISSVPWVSVIYRFSCTYNHTSTSKTRTTKTKNSHTSGNYGTSGFMQVLAYAIYFRLSSSYTYRYIKWPQSWKFQLIMCMLWNTIYSLHILNWPITK